MANILQVLLPLLVLLQLGKSQESSESSEERKRPKPIAPMQLNLTNLEMFSLTNALVETVISSCRPLKLSGIVKVQKYLAEYVIITAPGHSPISEELVQANFDKLHRCIDAESLLESMAGKSRIAREIPKIASDEEEESLVDIYLPEKEEPILERVLPITATDKSFENLFSLMYSVVMTACPLGKRPSPIFTLTTFAEILYWLTIDPVAYEAAQIKYLHYSNLVEDLKKCNKKLEMARSKSTRSRSVVA